MAIKRENGGSPMRKRGLALVLIYVLSLCYIPSVTAASVSGSQEELWRDDSFAKKARAIKESDWNKVETRDIAIVALFDLGRATDRIEHRIQSQMDRFSAFASWGASILALYLILQLILSLLVVIRLGRILAQRTIPKMPQREEHFQL